MLWSHRQCRVFVEVVRKRQVDLVSSFRDALLSYIGEDPVKSVIKGGPLASFSDGSSSSTRGANAGKDQAAVIELAGYLLERYDEAVSNLDLAGSTADVNESLVIDELLRLLVPVREVTNDFSTLGFYR
jgi:hypothetical protein